MNFPQFIIFALAIGCALLAACQPKPDPQPDRQPPFIDIGDGSKVTARGALLSAGELAIDQNVTIFFTHAEFGRESITVFHRPGDNRVFFCPMVVHLTENDIVIGDDLMTRDERLEKFRKVFLGGRMSGTTPTLVVNANSAASGTKLVEVFHELLESEITTIIAPYHVERD